MPMHHQQASWNFGAPQVKLQSFRRNEEENEIQEMETRNVGMIEEKACGCGCGCLSWQQGTNLLLD